MACISIQLLLKLYMKNPLLCQPMSCTTKNPPPGWDSRDFNGLRKTSGNYFALDVYHLSHLPCSSMHTGFMHLPWLNVQLMNVILDCWSSRRMDFVWNGFIKCIQARFTKESFYESILVKDSVELIREPFEMCFLQSMFASHLRCVCLRIKRMWEQYC